jgi:hypothetical protein
VTSHPNRRQKNGQPIRFLVLSVSRLRRPVRDADGHPIVVTAYTVKSARYQAKQRTDQPFELERA